MIHQHVYLSIAYSIFKLHLNQKLTIITQSTYNIYNPKNEYFMKET